MPSGLSSAGVLAGALAVAVVYLGGPSLFVVGLPLAVVAVILGAQSLAGGRHGAGYGAIGLGVLAVLVPVVQFMLQS